ncbi:aminodeoxychorismate synthase component I [Gordonia neofelifaecis]|uniref:Aminodeoxychorismate synthase component I n=1 Tax=Gordonia neofelifaecis NRRL B-59395 TaxID=644548 RepID=F1YKU7_9ACTN|nr:aminodeoxychorismate synthase component I [Gordonia neofelifaecis]EGD54741.1 aminodeoxychorismate synthase component I [Gordonia neofelifaecis NRRL B-59395]
MTAHTALDVLHALDAATRERGLPGPAGLIGDWADADAVIAPSVELTAGTLPPDRPDAFWFGALSFPVRTDESPLPTVVGGTVDGVLKLADGRWSWVSVSGAPQPEWTAAALDAPRRAAAWHAEWTVPDRDRHISAVQRCLEAIAAGEVYQACVCTRFDGRLDGRPLDFFTDIAAATAPAKSAWLAGDWGSIASFSPESFLDRRGGRVTSSPIKGTLPASADPAHLAASTKDVAENVMIVDLVRNDLGRVARTGSVTVPDLLTVVGAPGVWHLVSTVAADLPAAVGNDELLDATFPPASVTGTPKIRAADLLAGWEEHARGVYCGAVGIAGPDGLLDLNVAIRTVSATPDGALTLGVGGGITIDSSPEAEWHECLDKASSIVGFDPRR